MLMLQSLNIPPPMAPCSMIDRTKSLQKAMPLRLARPGKCVRVNGQRLA